VVIALFATVGLGVLTGCRSASRTTGEPELPVVPELFIDSFSASEGITFNARGQLFIGADQAIWLVEPDGSVRKLTEVDLHLGQAGIGEQDILAADFGPRNVFRHGPNNDGVIWRVTPGGEKTVAATGIADPNFILVLADGSFLVSDDGCDRIYHVTPEGEVSLWSDAIDYPNGMALSPDGSALYVAQIFEQLDPFVPSDKIWAIPVDAGRPTGPPKLVARTGGSMVDGLAMDELGHLYVADNGSGSIRRIDPATGEVVIIAEGMPHVASLVFGEGDFDHQAIYATSTRRGGGKIWKVRVGVGGAPLLRSEERPVQGLREKQ
jgi:sugar lactone lactonase YvrE